MSLSKVCIVCEAENPPEAEHCKECGLPLRVSDTMRISPKSDDITREVTPYQGLLPPRSIALRFLGQREPLLVLVQDEVILGRAGPAYSPQLIDLSDMRAGVLGVSRQHAIIRRLGHDYTIEDLNSTNGTRINTEQLVPGRPHKLRSGDQVQLGDFIMFVTFASPEG